MTSEYPIVTISTQPIELCKLLKIANMVTGGGEAKIVISEGYVSLNGEVEFQKRKKIYKDDIIEFNGDIVQVVVSNDKATSASKKAKSTEHNIVKSKRNKKQNNEVRREEPSPIKYKRKPISF